MKNKILVMFLVWVMQYSNGQCWMSFSAGEVHSVAIMNNGTLWAWGWNAYGQLGNGTTVDLLTPTQIGTHTDWLKVANKHASHTIALKSNGTLWGWGLNQSGQAGSFWNTNYFGYILVPTQIGTEANWNIITTGNKHSAAIKNDGTLWTWGRNENGQLGIGNYTDKDVPTRVGNDTDWVNVAAGDTHTLAIKQNGSIWAWGNNGDGQLGIGNTVSKNVPTRIGTLNHWTEVYAGGAFSIVKKNDGTLWSFGNNSFGELGIGTNLDRNSPTQIGNSNDWQSISTGGLHTLALKNNGTLYAWGININGMLGDGTLNNRNYPAQVQNPNGWAKVSAGGYHSIALQANQLYTWGDNWGGQLGNGWNGNGNAISIPTLINCPSSLQTMDQNQNKDWVFYPNPADRQISFHPNLTFSQCFSMDGKEIKISGTDFTLDVSNLASGYYILTFNDKNGKIVIEKIRIE